MAAAAPAWQPRSLVSADPGTAAPDGWWGSGGTGPRVAAALSIMGPSAPPSALPAPSAAGRGGGYISVWATGEQRGEKAKHEECLLPGSGNKAAGRKGLCRSWGDGRGGSGRCLLGGRVRLPEGRGKRTGPHTAPSPGCTSLRAPVNTTPSRSGPWKQAGSEDEETPVGPSSGCPRSQPGSDVHSDVQVRSASPFLREPCLQESFPLPSANVPEWAACASR